MDNPDSKNLNDNYTTPNDNEDKKEEKRVK